MNSNEFAELLDFFNAIFDQKRLNHIKQRCITSTEVKQKETAKATETKQDQNTENRANKNDTASSITNIFSVYQFVLVAVTRYSLGYYLFCLFSVTRFLIFINLFKQKKSSHNQRGKSAEKSGF